MFTELLNKRESCRSFSNRTLKDFEIVQILYSGYGIIQGRNKVTVPSAGGIYPCSLFMYTNKVEKTTILKNHKVYRYEPDINNIIGINEYDSNYFSFCCLNQRFVVDAAINIIICINFDKLENKYMDNAFRYGYLEAGHIAQNICLMSSELNLGSVCIGAFNSIIMKQMLQTNSKPIYIISIGGKR